MTRKHIYNMLHVKQYTVYVLFLLSAISTWSEHRMMTRNKTSSFQFKSQNQIFGVDSMYSNDSPHAIMTSKIYSTFRCFEPVARIVQKFQPYVNLGVWFEKGENLSTVYSLALGVGLINISNNCSQACWIYLI